MAPLVIVELTTSKEVASATISTGCSCSFDCNNFEITTMIIGIDSKKTCNMKAKQCDEIRYVSILANIKKSLIIDKCDRMGPNNVSTYISLVGYDHCIVSLGRFLFRLVWGLKKILFGQL